MKAESKFLASEDFIGAGTVELVIAAVYEHKGETLQDGKKKDVFTVAFEKTPKRLVLNATNRKTLSAAFGSKVPNWIGKTVGMYVKGGVRNPAGGGLTTGLRIKADPDPKLLEERRKEMTGEA